MREPCTLRVLKVMSPKGTNLVLAAHIPHREIEVLIDHGLHIEAYKEAQLNMMRLDTTSTAQSSSGSPSSRQIP